MKTERIYWCISWLYSRTSHIAEDFLRFHTTVMSTFKSIIINELTPVTRYYYY